MNVKFHTIISLSLLLTVSRVFAIDIVPSGGTDDAPVIQATLDSLQEGDTLKLLGDFVIAKTIYLPSDFTWILEGSLTLSADAVLDEAGWFDPPVDARRRTGITEKAGGATKINMSGGTYYGNAAGYGESMRFINFVSVTHSSFHDMHITDASDDNFTLGPGSNHNECRNLRGSFAGGNALTDKGDHNKWYDCIAEDCASDGWTPKCRYSEFHRCIGRRNAAPGFGMFARLDGSGDPVDLGEIIVGNKFYNCEAYDNGRGGFSFNIAGTSGHGSIIRDNYIQAVCYNNRMQGVSFRNKQDDGIIENNEVDIVAFGNKGERTNGEISSYAGGLGVEGPMDGITGSVVAYDNGGYDVNIRSASNCTITAYHPEDQNQPVLNKGSNGNTIYVNDFSCSDQFKKWCQYKYCGAPTPKLPDAPADLTANVVSYSQIDLSWTDTTGNEDGFRIEQKKAESFTLIATVDANVTSYSSIGLSEMTEYTYRVRAFNAAGYSEYSNQISVTTGEDISSNAIHLAEGMDMGLIIYPNPIQESAQIAYSITGNCFVSMILYNSDGQKVTTMVNENKQQGHYTVTLIRSDLPAGMYYISLYTGNRVQTMKLLLLK